MPKEKGGIDVTDIANQVIDSTNPTDDRVVDKGQPNQPIEGDKGKPKETEVKFDDLDDSIKRFIDQERTNASRTAREKALKEAVDNPEIVTAITERITREQNMTLDEKVTERERAVALRENSLEAREKLLEAGLVGEDLTEVLTLIVDENLDSTLNRAQIFVEKFNDAVTRATEAKTKELVQSIPKPKVTGTQAKAFKDMNFEERANLKKQDPARYEAERAKRSSKI